MKAPPKSYLMSYGFYGRRLIYDVIRDGDTYTVKIFTVINGKKTEQRDLLRCFFSLEEANAYASSDLIKAEAILAELE